jgi:hypothetical protein
MQEEHHDDHRQDDAFEQRLPDAVERLLRVIRRCIDLVELKLGELRFDRFELLARDFR